MLRVLAVHLASHICLADALLSIMPPDMLLLPHFETSYALDIRIKADKGDIY